MNNDEWQKQLSGKDCAFCLPRVDENEHWSKIAKLGVSTLYLHRVQGYKGYSLLVFDLHHAVRCSQLSLEEWNTLCADLLRAQLAIELAVQPDHMNIAALGNQMAHLHWHIIPRYKHDPRWGAPIWTNTEAEMASGTLSEVEFSDLLNEIKKGIV